MHPQLKRLMLAFAFVLSVAVTPGYALAGDWLPAFKRDTHVYVDPSLKNSDHPVDFSGMEKQVKELAAKNHLQVYIVATERSFPENQVIARDIVNDLQARWNGASDFPRDDFLLEVWVRQAGKPNKGSVAAYAGNRLQEFGYNDVMMRDPSYGPVKPALKQFMPRDPQNALLQIVRNVNAGVERIAVERATAERNRVEAQARQERENTEAQAAMERDRAEAATRAQAEQEQARQDAIVSAERSAQMEKWGMIGFIVIALGGTLIWLTVRYNKAKAAASEVLEKLRTDLQNAGHWYEELDGAYLGFLRLQKDWRKKFDEKGKTAARFKEALGWYGGLTVRKLAAAEMFDKAEKAFNATRWPSTTGFESCVAILTVNEVTVSERNLSIEDAELFKGIVLESKYQPAELLANMDELFKKTNKALSEIKKALDGATKNRGEIAELLAQVDQLKLKLGELGLSFAPYAEAYGQIVSERDSFLAIIDKDPLAAFSGTQKVEEDAEALKAKIEHALKIFASLDEVVGKITTARARAAEGRAKKVAFAYPEASNEKSGDKPGEPNFTLSEKGYNPDDSLSQADAHLAAAREALLVGDLDTSESEKSAALAAATHAFDLVETVFAAKAFVESQLLGVRGNLAHLEGEINSALPNLAALKDEFLPANWEGEGPKFFGAKVLSQSSDREFGKIREAYFKQDFVQARLTLTALAAAIAEGRKKLAEIGARLSELRGLRNHARAVTQEAIALTTALVARLKQEAFTTPASTDAAFSALQPELEGLKTDTARNITDWPAAAAQADAFLAKAKEIGGAIDKAKHEYAQAGEAIASVRGAIASAEAVVGQNEVREAARHKYSDAVRVLESLEAAYRVAKSDWAALTARAESQHAVAQEAERLARADINLAREAQSSIESVSSRISDLRARSFFQTVSWGGRSRVISLGTVLNLSTAEGHLASATQRLLARDYEGALDYARQANSDTDSAEAWANAQLAEMIAEQERQWREEEAELERQREAERRRQREAEEAAEAERRRRQREQDEKDAADRRRRQEEDERRRRDDSSNNGGGGGNYGGGGDGGNYNTDKDTPTGGGDGGNY